jgi:hypothetical protein
MSALTPFVHARLDLNTKCIRVVKIDAGEAKEPLRCSIRVASLSTFAYRCLSYHWGPSSDKSIVIDNQRLRVTDNLFAYLLQARAMGMRHWLWIDAICIDQSNVQERNHQVQQMSEIYRNALEVHVWPYHSRKWQLHGTICQPRVILQPTRLSKKFGRFVRAVATADPERSASIFADGMGYYRWRARAVRQSILRASMDRARARSS